MNTIFYLLVSIAEWLALLLLTLAMFKFRFNGYWGQIILTSAVLSLLSHFVFQVIEQRMLATILQPPVVFLFLWQMFRIQIFYAGIMTVYGYMGYTTVQLLILLVAGQLGAPMESLAPSTMPMYAVQASTAAAVLLIVYALYRSRIGYTFVPDFEYAPVALRGVNLRLFLLSLLGFIWLAVSNIINFSTWAPTLLKLFVIIILGVLLYYAQRKENAND